MHEPKLQGSSEGMGDEVTHWEKLSNLSFRKRDYFFHPPMERVWGQAIVIRYLSKAYSWDR
jgi:hypothetical protein